MYPQNGTGDIHHQVQNLPRYIHIVIVLSPSHPRVVDQASHAPYGLGRNRVSRVDRPFQHLRWRLDQHGPHGRHHVVPEPFLRIWQRLRKKKKHSGKQSNFYLLLKYVANGLTKDTWQCACNVWSGSYSLPKTRGVKTYSTTQEIGSRDACDAKKNAHAECFIVSTSHAARLQQGDTLPTHHVDYRLIYLTLFQLQYTA